VAEASAVLMAALLLRLRRLGSIREEREGPRRI
jgi:hypothetical protein